MSRLLINPYRYGLEFNPLTAIPWHSVFWADNPAQAFTPDQQVSTWTNSGSDGVAATQATAGRKPTWKASVAAYNNHSAILFDSVDDDLLANFVTDPILEFSLVVVGNLSSTDSSSVLISPVAAATSTQKTIIRSTTGKWRQGSAGVASTVSADINPHFFMSYILGNNGAASITVGDIITTGTNGNAVACSGFCMNSNNGNDEGGGHRAFVGLYAGKISDHAQWANLKAWVASYYALTT